jgi:hypothetical protein
VTHPLWLVPFVLALAVLAARGAGALLGFFWQRQDRVRDLHPWALRAPLLVAALPAVGLAVALLAFVPSVPWTWLGGSCACHAYGGLHVCPLHPQHALQLLAPLGLAAALLLGLRARAVASFALRLRDVVHLTAEGRPDPSGVLTLDLGGRPFAFVAGLYEPAVFVEGAWWAGLGARERLVVAAHEQAHITAGDPVALAALDLLLTLFAPRARTQVLADWQLAAEVRADAAAATADGDPLFVAEVLCRHPRAAAPAGTMALGGRALATRVHALMDGVTPEPVCWSVAARTAVLVGLLAGGHLLHGVLELALHLLS